MDKLVTAQCVTDDPAPLLQAAGDVLALADVLRPNATAQPFTTEAEQELWEILGELKACYERDRGQIQTAHNIQASQEADDVTATLEDGRTGSAGPDGWCWITATLLLPAVTRSTSRLTWAGPRCDMMTTATGPAHTRASYRVSPADPARGRLLRVTGVAGCPGSRRSLPNRQLRAGRVMPGRRRRLRPSRYRLLVSVLTATFNRRATFLPQCLDSVRHQVGDGFTHEHIVVDDCSADGTWITSSKPPGRIRALFVEPTAAACWAALKAGLIDVGPQADDRPRAVAPLCGTGLKSKPRRPEGSLAP